MHPGGPRSRKAQPARIGSSTTDGRTVRRLIAGLAALLVALASAAPAHAAAARVRWQPSGGDGVVGYHVYVREAGLPYGEPHDAALGVEDANGILSYVVDALSAGHAYRFAVTAYTDDGSESELSDEFALGAGLPCTIDHCSSPTTCDFGVVADGESCDDRLFCNGVERCQAGVCQPGEPPQCSDEIDCTRDSCDEALGRCRHDPTSDSCCTTDADCADADACTAGETCVAGACTSVNASCPEPACTVATCDPHEGCGVIALDDGAPCNRGDPCNEPGMCVAGRCGTGNGIDIEPRIIRLSPLRMKGKLAAIGMVRPTGTVDPTATGATLELADATGAVLYRAAIPAAAVRATDGGTRFLYVDSHAGPSRGSIRRLEIRRHGDAWLVSVRAVAREFLAAMHEPSLTWVLHLGEECARRLDLQCARSKRGGLVACR